MTYRGRVNPRGPKPHAVPRSSRVRRGILVGLALLLGGTVTAPSVTASAQGAGPSVHRGADYPDELAPFYTQTLTWTPCDDNLQCAWLTVPLDYSDPSGATITIRVNKAPAKGPAPRQGALVINPGGPGASGLDFTSYTANSIAPKVNAAFDIVGFDPRGVGKSAPITCVTGRQTTALLETDATPSNPDQVKHAMDMASIVGRGCLAKSPNLARHVGTENTVRDMDILRAALGDQKLNWLGWSYGTYLGTLYLEAFPDRVGRFVLDGALDPANDIMQVSRGQSHGFQVAVSRFAADCARHASCAYKGGTKAVLAGINRLLAGLDTKQIKTDDPKRPLTQADALSAIFYSMYSPIIWPSLRIGLKEATQGNGSGLMAIADIAAERTGPNTYGNNAESAFYAISCWDVPPPPGQAGLAAAAARWSKGAPVPEMAKSMAWGNAPCSTWYGHSGRVPAPAASTTTAPVVVVGTLYDPATPYPWAVSLSKQLPTSTLLTFRGDGHTAYGNGSACINKAVEAYLLTGTTPAPGLVCN